MIGGVNFQVRLSGQHHRHTGFKDIKRMISSSRLSSPAKDISTAIFETLGLAEAHVHRTSIDKVHFHEVGAIDSIVDIVGAAIGIEYFGFDSIYASEIPMSRGWVKCGHGRMPVPAPATLEILKGVPVISSSVKDEIVTPTGAAILRTIVAEFGINPVSKIKKVGYGLGDKVFKEIPNSLRLLIGEGEPLVVIEANIDDMNPQIYEYLIERLLEKGAVDVTISPALMKKRRPASILSVLCRDHDRDGLVRTILEETTSLGVRHYRVERKILEREFKVVRTKFGNVTVKIAKDGKNVLNVSPEYEDCKKIARIRKVPLKNVMLEALNAWKRSD